MIGCTSRISLLNYRFKKFTVDISVKYSSIKEQFEGTQNDPKPYSAIPQPNWSLPFVGTAWHYRLGKFSINDMSKTRREFYENYGPLVRETIHGETLLHVFDLDDIRTVYNSEHRKPLIEPLLLIIKQFRQLKGYPVGIGATNGDEWHRLRSAVNRMMMRPASVANFLDFQQEVIDDWIDNLKAKYITKSGEIPSIETQLSKWNFETSSYNVLNKRFHWLDNDETDSEMMNLLSFNNNMFQKATTFQFGWLPWHRWFSTPTWQRFIEEETYFYEVIDRYLTECLHELNSYIEKINNGLIQEDDSKQFLFLRHAVSSEKLSIEEIKSSALTLFTDGFSTTVPTATFMLDLLSRHPQYQESLYKEICNVVGPNQSNKLTQNHMNELPLVKAFLKETFRFFPIQPGYSRILNADLILSGHKIPSGTSVLLETAVHLKDSKQFDQPEEFRPERWLRRPKLESQENDTEVKENRSPHPFALIPFSHGSRMCLGRRFAEQELILLLVKILQQFKLQNTSNGKMGVKFQILNVPDSPLKIAVTPRHNN